MEKFLFFAILSLFLLAGCATTTISSFANPDIKISEYKKIVVLGNTRDVEFRKILEADVVDALVEKGVNAVSHINVISPLKEYSPAELQKIYAENGIDCVLSITETGKSHNPVSTMLSYELLEYPVFYTITKFEMILTDAKTGELTLKATAGVDGVGMSNTSAISKSLSKKIAEEYLAQE